MNVKGFGLAATMIAFAAVHPANSADGPQQGDAAAREMASVNYLIGRWGCAHTVGTFSGTYKTIYSKALGGLWLREIWDFPAQDTAERNEPAVTAEALMGYDVGRQAWVRFFANSLGQHFEIRMSDTANGWSFKYVTFFPRTRPETADPDAIFTKKSDTEYTIDGPTYPQGATRVTEHHTCHKL
jgi:hypothetical protein